MKRMMSLVFALVVAMGAYAQDEEAEKLERFDAFVQVKRLSSETGLTVAKPGEEAQVAKAYKAYPYGSVFTVGAGETCRVYFSDMTYAVVRGPAVFVPKASEKWTKVNLAVEMGDYNISVHQRVQPDQFSVTTPLGTFESIQGIARLRLAEIKDGEVKDEDFSFRVMQGTARFKGLHYSMPELTQANTFASSDVKGMRVSDIKGRIGEVKMDLPMSGDGKQMPFSLTPGATVKITREKAPGSDNWTVSVLTLFANGEAQNYFCYVENRGEGFCTGELIAEINPPEPEEGEEGGEDADEESYADEAEDEPDEMSDFDDYDLM